MGGAGVAALGGAGVGGGGVGAAEVLSDARTALSTVRCRGGSGRALTIEAWMEPAIGSLSPQCGLCRWLTRAHPRRPPTTPACRATASTKLLDADFLAGGADRVARVSVGMDFDRILLFVGLRHDGDVRDACAFDRVHYAGEGTEGNTLVGTHVDDFLG